MPQIELTLDDLQAVLAMAEITVLARGRKILPLTEPLAQKIEKYLGDLAEAQKAAAQAPQGESEPVDDKPE